MQKSDLKKPVKACIEYLPLKSPRNFLFGLKMILSWSAKRWGQFSQISPRGNFKAEQAEGVLNANMFP